MRQAKCSPVRLVRAQLGAAAATPAVRSGSHNPAVVVKKGHETNADRALADWGLVMGAPAVQATFAIEPVLLSKPDAARALGMSVDSFERYVLRALRCVRRGRLRLYPVAELRRWADENAEELL